MPGEIESISYINLGNGNHPIDAVTVGGKTVPDFKTINNQTITGTGNITINELPAVSSSDNNKILQVVNGVWTLVSPASVYSGSSFPSNSTGNDGDLYLQTS